MRWFERRWFSASAAIAAIVTLEGSGSVGSIVGAAPAASAGAVTDGVATGAAAQPASNRALTAKSAQKPLVAKSNDQDFDTSLAQAAAQCVQAIQVVDRAYTDTMVGLVVDADALNA